MKMYTCIICQLQACMMNMCTQLQCPYVHMHAYMYLYYMYILLCKTELTHNCKDPPAHLNVHVHVHVHVQVHVHVGDLYVSNGKMTSFIQ